MDILTSFLEKTAFVWPFFDDTVFLAAFAAFGASSLLFLSFIWSWIHRDKSLETQASPAPSPTASISPAPATGVFPKDSKTFDKTEIIPPAAPPALKATEPNPSLAEIQRRLAALEQEEAKHHKETPLFVEPLLKRIKDIEAEIGKIKSSVAAPPVNGAAKSGDMTALTARVDKLQKVIEHLAEGTDISKPS